MTDCLRCRESIFAKENQRRRGGNNDKISMDNWGGKWKYIKWPIISDARREEKEKDKQDIINRLLYCILYLNISAASGISSCSISNGGVMEATAFNKVGLDNHESRESDLKNRSMMGIVCEVSKRKNIFR